MQRDMDLIRDLLAFHQSEGRAPFPIDRIDGVVEHTALMIEKGLLHGTINDLCGLMVFPVPMRVVKAPGIDGEVMLFRLTWSGHDFLELARQDTLWNRAKTRVIQAVGGLTIELLTEALRRGALDALGQG